MATEKSDVGEFRSVVTLVSLTVAGVAYWNAMPFLVGGFVDDFGWSPELAGRISSLQLFATMAMLWVAAMTVHRWNLRTMVLGAALVAVLSDFCAAWLESAALIILTRIVTGLSAGVLLGAVYAAVSRVERPTRVYGIVVASMSVSGLVWFLGIPPLLEYSGMTGPFLGLAAVSLVALALALAWFPRSGGQEDVPSAQLGLLGLLTVPVLLLAVGLLMQSAVAGAYWAYWERIGVDSGLSAQGIGIVLSVGAVSGMLGGVLAAWMDGKVGDATALIGSLAIMAIGYAAGAVLQPGRLRGGDRGLVRRRQCRPGVLLRCVRQGGCLGQARQCGQPPLVRGRGRGTRGRKSRARVGELQSDDLRRLPGVAGKPHRDRPGPEAVGIKWPAPGLGG